MRYASNYSDFFTHRSHIQGLIDNKTFQLGCAVQEKNMTCLKKTHGNISITPLWKELGAKVG